MQPKIFLAVALIIVGTIIAAKLSKSNTEKSEDTNHSTEVSMEHRAAEEKLRTDMRQLWEDHIVWTRNVMFCILDDLPGTNQAVNRLLKNQDDIGNAVKSFYGEEAGKKLTELLREHITIAADLLKITKVDNATAFDVTNKKWEANADEIAAFLSKANPNWKPAEMKIIMREHLSLTINEAVARKKRNYDDDVTAYEMVQVAILKMSDMLSDGIIKQFPAKFKDNETVGAK